MRLRFYLSKCQRSKIVNKWNFWSVGNQHTLIPIQLQGRTIQKHLSKFHAHIQSFHLQKLILQIMHMTHAKTSVQGQSLKDSVCVCVCVHSVMSHFCHPMDYSLPGYSVHDSPGKNTGVGCHFLLQEIFLFLTQELNL